VSPTHLSFFGDFDLDLDLDPLEQDLDLELLFDLGRDADRLPASSFGTPAMDNNFA